MGDFYRPSLEMAQTTSSHSSHFLSDQFHWPHLSHMAKSNYDQEMQSSRMPRKERKQVHRRAAASATMSRIISITHTVSLVTVSTRLTLTSTQTQEEGKHKAEGGLAYIFLHLSWSVENIFPDLCTVPSAAQNKKQERKWHWAWGSE